MLVKVAQLDLIGTAIHFVPVDFEHIDKYKLC